MIPTDPHTAPTDRSADLSKSGVYQAFFDLSLELLCTADETLHFRELNPAWESVLGWSLDELRSQPFTAFVHPDDLESTSAEAARLMEPGMTTVGFENRYRHKDGHWVHLQWVSRTANGIFYAAARDVSAFRKTEAQLREREAEQTAVLESIPGTCLRIGPDNQLWSVHGEARIGHLGDLHSQLSTSITECLPEPLKHRLLPALARIRTTGETQRLAYEWATDGADAAQFEVHVAATPDGGATVLINDITETVYTRDRLDAQTELLQAIVRTQSNFLSHQDPHQVFDTLLGDLLRLSKSEYGFIGEIHRNPDGTKYLKTRAITNVAWSAETQAFYEENAPDGLEFRNLDTLFGAAIRDEEIVIANTPGADPRRGGLPPGHPPLNAFLGHPLFADGEMVGMFGLANRPDGYDDALVAYLRPLSVTIARLIESLRMQEQNRAAERQLRESEMRHRATLDSAPYAIVTTDEQGTITSANPAVERILKTHPVGLIGSSIESLLGPGPASAGVSLVGQLGSAQATARELVLQRRDQSEFPADISVGRFELKNQVHYAVTIQDISDRKRMAKLQSEFVSTVSHELRTPLTSIRGALGLLHGGIAGQIPVQAKEYVAIALSNSERLSRLINDILDMEKIQSGALEFSQRTISIDESLHNAQRTNDPFAASQNVRLVRTGRIPAGEILVDPDRLAQVFANLISNAIKHAPDKSKIELSAEQSGRWVRLSVRDQGPGVPADFQERLFTRFAQADASTTRAVSGTGLGLSIAKALVEEMGGRIGYQDRSEGGSVFWFELPFLNACTAAASDSTAPRVLICEDDPGIWMLLQDWLEEAGFQTDVAPTLERAFRLLGHRAYAAATLDFGLADGAGEHLLHELRSNEDTSAMPVVALSGSEERLDAAAFLVSEILRKPCDGGRIMSAVQRALARTAQSKPRLLHVEDDPDLRNLVRMALPTEWDLSYADNLKSARAELEQSDFDVVLLDLGLPDGSGESLLSEMGSAQVVVLSDGEPSPALRGRAAHHLPKRSADWRDIRKTLLGLVQTDESGAPSAAPDDPSPETSP